MRGTFEGSGRKTYNLCQSVRLPGGAGAGGLVGQSQGLELTTRLMRQSWRFRGSGGPRCIFRGLAGAVSGGSIIG